MDERELNWNDSIEDPDSFAFRGILNGGVVLYESE